MRKVCLRPMPIFTPSSFPNIGSTISEQHQLLPYQKSKFTNSGLLQRIQRMAALRTVAHATGKSLSIPLIPKKGLHGSFPALRHSPIRATSLSVQSLSPQPTISSKRSFFTVIQSYQRGLLFRSGKHSGEKDPGLRWSFPIFHRVRKVDMRTRTMQVPSQELMTKDNVTIHVDAVAFYKVEDPLKALCNIEDYDAAVNEAAQVGPF